VSAALALVWAASERPAAGQFASGVDLVEVYATVVDGRGEPVTGLSAADFSVAEDGRPQTVSAFAAGEFPLAVAVGLDRSFSMTRSRLATAVSAVREFAALLKPSDQVMVVAIGSETEVLAPLSTDHAAAVNALDTVDPWGTTPLYDATLAALRAIQPATGRRALVLISDGDDRYSKATEADVVSDARRKDVLIYPIALGARRPPVFVELAAVTGGRSFEAREPRELQITLAAIARELRLQYLIGYTPARSEGGAPRWRSIQVTVNRSNLRVRARDGYVG
jgi:Ca-activated chloride channel family protein